MESLRCSVHLGEMEKLKDPGQPAPINPRAFIAEGYGKAKEAVLVGAAKQVDDHCLSYERGVLFAASLCEARMETFCLSLTPNVTTASPSNHVPLVFPRVEQVLLFLFPEGRNHAEPHTGHGRGFAQGEGLLPQHRVGHLQRRGF